MIVRGRNLHKDDARVKNEMKASPGRRQWGKMWDKLLGYEPRYVLQTYYALA